MRIGAVLLSSILLLGCASVVKERGHDDVAKIVHDRTGYKTRWEKGPPSDAQIARWVDELLNGGVTRNRAVEIALVNNPSLQVTYEELGVSQADMVQAGLLSNPTLSGSIGFPLRGNIEYEASLTQDFLDIFVLPLRKRVARQQFTADTLRVAHETLRVATQVRQALSTYQAQARMVELERSIVEAAQAAAELATRQHEAGNINDLALTQERSMYEQAALDLERDELALTEARESLNRLLGLWGPRTSWRLAEPLPDLPSSDPPLEHLESFAVDERLDVRAARFQSLLLWNALELAKNSRYFGFIDVGVHTHRDSDGARLLGPTLSLELPIFDQRQALIARLEAQYRQAVRRLDGIAIDARSEVRSAHARLLSARRVVDRFRTTLMPLRENAVQQTQLQYNAMQMGLFELLAAKQAQITSYRAYIDGVRDYWSARAELEMSLGGRIPVTTSSTKGEHP
jgi:cobalt-zinc-cadmium efflux system outer membrane protein